jgi:hypothetical protein
MKRRSFLVGSLSLCAAGVLVAACTHTPDARASAPPGTMPNGLYKVVAYPAAREGPPAIRYDPRLADPTSTDDAKWIALDTTDYVPLVLAAAPRVIPVEGLRPPTPPRGDSGRSALRAPRPSPDGRIRLEIALAKEHVPTLAGFTRRNIGGLAAIVLDGDVVTVHKQRAIITDGRMQITRCTDRACEKLFTKLNGG